MSVHAILNEDGNVLSASLLEWATWMEGARAQRVIEQTFLPGDIKVSTVFLGLNHQYMPGGPPLWFETMVFGPPETSEIFEQESTFRPDLGYCERYTTLSQAVAGHQEALVWAQAQ